LEVEQVPDQYELAIKIHGAVAFNVWAWCFLLHAAGVNMDELYQQMSQLAV
jgi:hypothetical protein